MLLCGHTGRLATVHFLYLRLEYCDLSVVGVDFVSNLSASLKGNSVTQDSFSSMVLLPSLLSLVVLQTANPRCSVRCLLQDHAVCLSISFRSCPRCDMLQFWMMSDG